MPKAAMVADVHLGVGSRLDDIIWALGVIRDYCQKHNIDVVLVLGDLYHDRESIGIDVLCKSHEFFVSARDVGQTWIAFPGNHDMFLKRSWDLNSLKTLSQLITIIDDVKVIKLDDRRFWILPFIYSESAYMRVLRRIGEQHEDGDVLLTHIGVRSAVKNTCFLLQDWSTVNFMKSPFKQVFGGHFHTHQQVGTNFWYVGSIIPFKFDEGDTPHGFITYDLESGEHEFVNIWKAGREVGAEGCPPPQFNTLSDELLEEKREKDVRNRMIRVALSRDYSQNEKEEIRSKFMGWGARRVQFMDLAEDDPEVREEFKANITVPASKLFLKYLERDEKNIDGYSKSLLKRLNKEIMDEGDQEYQKLRLED